MVVTFEQQFLLFGVWTYRGLIDKLEILIVSKLFELLVVRY